MCNVVHCGGRVGRFYRGCGSELVFGDGWGRSFRDNDLFDIELNLLFGFGGRGGGLKNGERGSQADTGRRLGIGEDAVYGLDGEVNEFFGFVAEEKGAVVLGVGEDVLERERIATPAIDGVAVYAGLLCRGGDGGAGGQGANDCELLGGESVIEHGNHFLISA